MSMDYQFHGSASYSRFEREITEIAESIFEGKKNSDLVSVEQEQKKDVGEHFKQGDLIGGLLATGFGSFSDFKGKKFSFPDGTPAIITKWLDDPYKELTVEETQSVWNEVKKHPEIEKISYQIYHELKDLVDCKMGWEIW